MGLLQVETVVTGDDDNGVVEMPKFPCASYGRIRVISVIKSLDDECCLSLLALVVELSTNTNRRPSLI